MGWHDSLAVKAREMGKSAVSATMIATRLERTEATQHSVTGGFSNSYKPLN
jgi:hypothetical protein